MTSIGIIADTRDVTSEAANALEKRLGAGLVHCPEDAKDKDILIVLGGDGFMLHTLHHYMHLNIPFYGMNRGTVGFLMNAYDVQSQPHRIHKSVRTTIHPIKMEATHLDDSTSYALAINEVSLLRATGQAAKIKIEVSENLKLSELVCDGVMVATPAGSTAYNFSAGGSILPLKANLLALTPISPFRPRRWRGALLPRESSVTFEIKDADRRKVNAVADFAEYEFVKKVTVREYTEQTITLLFDKGHSLEERILKEQFTV